MKWLPSAHHCKAPLRQLKVGHFIHNLLLFIGILFVRTFEGHQDQLLELVQHWYWYQSILCAAFSDHLLRPFGPDLVRTFALVTHWTASVELSTRGLSCRRPAAVPQATFWKGLSARLEPKELRSVSCKLDTTVAHQPADQAKLNFAKSFSSPAASRPSKRFWSHSLWGKSFSHQQLGL